MKNGVLFIVCIFTRMGGMQPWERGNDRVSLPGAVREDTNVEVSKRAFDLQVADCIAELIQCSVDQDVFCHGTEENVRSLFAEIDNLDANLLAYFDRRELGNVYLDERRKNLEEELLQALGRGGTFKELKLYACLTRDLSHETEDEKNVFLQEQKFYQKDMPLLLNQCSVSLLQRLINTDPELRKAIGQKKIVVEESLLWQVVRAELPGGVYDPLALLSGATHDSEQGINSSGCPQLPLEDVTQSNEQVKHSDDGQMSVMANKEQCKGVLQRQSSEIIPGFVARVEMPLVLPQESRPPSAFAGSDSANSCYQPDPFSDTASPISSLSGVSTEKKSKKSLSDYICNCACL